MLCGLFVSSILDRRMILFYYSGSENEEGEHVVGSKSNSTIIIEEVDEVFQEKSAELASR